MRPPIELLLCGALALLVPPLATGCASTPEAAAPTSQWLQPSPILQQKIDSEAQRLPWTRGVELMEQIRWFTSIGEPAYATLLELAGDNRDHVAAAALASLGATGDERLVPYVQAIEWSDDRTPELKLERARTLVRLGDWSEIPTLIEGLESDSSFTRTLCSEALVAATSESMGYDPKAERNERETAVARWKRWWLRRGDGILAGTRQPTDGY